MANVDIVLGLGFGDEGKGGIVDFLCRKRNAKLVVRFNGGAQAGHNVVTPDGRHHTFSQFGAGTFAGADTLLSRFAIVNPIFAFAEAKHLESVGVPDPFVRLFVENGALVTTPFHVAMNRLREMARSDGKHGSCGMGIGETMSDWIYGRPTIRAFMLNEPECLRRELHKIQFDKLAEAHVLLRNTMHIDESLPLVAREMSILRDPHLIEDTIESYKSFAEKVTLVGASYLVEQLKSPGHIVFEGAQGVLLDQDWGFHPHTTWTDCTFDNADKLLADAAGRGSYVGTDVGTDARTEVGTVRRVGVLRSFLTRHGAGPLPTESGAALTGDHNVPTPWQGSMRFGAFDMVLARYALSVVGGVDGLALTHLDKVGDGSSVCIGYACNAVNQVDRSLFTGASSWSLDPLVTEIRTGRRFDLARQEQIGCALATMRPSILTTTSRDKFLSLIQRELGVPMNILSRGPTCDDKVET